MPMRGKTGQQFALTFDPELASFRVAFEDWAKLVKNWKAAWKDVVTLFRRHEKHHFETEGMSTGARFAALNDRPTFEKSYAGWKARHYPGLPILQRERVLFRALVEGGQGSINKQTNTSLIVGVNPAAVVKDPATGKPYSLGKAAHAHAKGIGNQFGGKLPVRPPIRFDGNVQNRNSFGYAVGQILQAHIVKARRKAFKKDIEDAIGGPAGAHTSPQKTIRSVLAREWK
jgi:hypothetical protein